MPTELTTLTRCVEDGDVLTFTFTTTGDTKHVRCRRWEQGKMLLAERDQNGPLYRNLAILEGSQFVEVWPEVKLKYWRDDHDWKVTFRMPRSVRMQHTKAPERQQRKQA